MRALVLFTVLVSLAARAHADNAVAARALYKRGIEEFKAKKFGEASITLLKSYELHPRPDTLFALAQAERFDNRCKDAIPHYKKLLEENTDLTTAKAIQANMELCVTDEAKLPEKPAEKPVEEVKVNPRVVERHKIIEGRPYPEKLDAVLLGGGALAIGGSIALFVASASSRSDSDAATNLDEANRLYDRSRTERMLGFITSGVGVALVTVAVVRMVTRKPSSITLLSGGPGVGLGLARTW